MKKIELLVCAHKKDESTRNGGVYRAIQVGKALHPELNLGYTCDNEGENISEKNPFWCEYTALYWGWKNQKDVEYSGLCHYRRYFDINITEDNIDQLFKKNDILVIKQDSPMLSKRSRLKNLAWVTTSEDAILFLDTLLYMYPEYKQEIMDYFFNSRLSIPYSMFIAKKEIFDQFCEFIFPVFFEMEKKMKSHSYSRQKRAMGYFGEYSLGLFILCKHLRYKKIPLKAYGDAATNISLKRKIKTFLLSMVWRFIDNMSKTPKEFTCPTAIKVGLKQDGISLKAIK
jgi:hypothetical protein